jgi:hypothetical protein
MGIGKFVGSGRATHVWTEALGGFSVIHGFDFTEPYPKHVHARLVLGAIESGSFRMIAGGSTFESPVDTVIAINSFRVHAEEWDDGCFHALYISPENFVAAGISLPNAEPWFEDPVVRDPSLAQQVRAVHDGDRGDGHAPAPGSLCLTVRRCAGTVAGAGGGRA